MGDEEEDKEVGITAEYGPILKYPFKDRIPGSARSKDARIPFFNYGILEGM